MKLEVGMYVRTKNGSIDKIIDTTEEWYELDDDECEKLYKIYRLNHDYYDDEFDENTNWFLERFFIKASHNIIDLIEVGDYVDGNEVIYSTLKDGGNIVIYKTGFCANNEEIKSIVTKEQFESMKYSLEG